MAQTILAVSHLEAGDVVAAVKAFDLALISGGPSKCLSHAIMLCMKVVQGDGNKGACDGGGGGGSSHSEAGTERAAPTLQMAVPAVAPSFVTSVPIARLNATYADTEAAGAGAATETAAATATLRAPEAAVFRERCFEARVPAIV